MIIGSSYEMADAILFAQKFGNPFWVNLAIVDYLIENYDIN